MNATTNEPIHKTFSTNVKAENGERAVTAIISTAAVDRDGEVLIPQGCNAKDYEKNPIVCYAHDSYWLLPVGKCLALKRDEDSLTAKIQFAERPETLPIDQEWEPDTILAMFQQGILNAFSVGFMPIEVREATSRDITKFGDGCRRVYSKWSLLEISVVSLPANQEAVALAVSKGLLTQESADKMFKKIAEPKAEEITPEPKAEEPVVKYIRRALIDEDAPAPVKRLVIRELDKLRGRVYS